MRKSRQALFCAALCAVVAVPVAQTGRSGSHAVAAARSGAQAYLQPRTDALDHQGIARLAAARWRPYRLDAGSPVVRVSPAYADPAAIAKRWSDFFESLLHGPELSLLDAYIAPIAEVQAMCGGSDVLGCYGENHLVVPDQGADGVSATTIATHEYGHHVAFNRVDPPWRAIDSGPKRWATYERVCPRAATGTAYPGDESLLYRLNPGEAWAETYRVLNEQAWGLPMTWPIVDPSFEPDAGALAAARADVVDPWTAPTTTATRHLFGSGKRSWTMRVSTPLDGALQARLQPRDDDVTLRGSDGKTLASGAWTGPQARGLDYVVCGRRTVVVRVTRHTLARAFTLRLSIP